MNARELLIQPTAYMPPAEIIDGLLPEDAERRPAAGLHSVAELVAHMSFWQEWFLRRCASQPDPMILHAALGWPDVPVGDWPDVKRKFIEGLQRGAALGDDALLKSITPPIEFPPLARYTVRDALTHIAGHNAHHLGQVIVLRQMMGVWPPPVGSYTW